MNRSLKILYTNFSGTIIGAYDKQAGRILGWARTNNNVFILAPQLDSEIIKKEILDKQKSGIKTISLPFTKKETSSNLGIILSFSLRTLISPLILFKKLPIFDFAINNSPFFVDIVPILWLKFFGRCDFWIALIDNIIPKPNNRLGNRFINTIVYLEWRTAVFLAHHFATAVFTINPEVKNELMKLGIPGSKIHFSQCGLLLDKIIGRKTNKKLYDACYLGRITKNKGIFDLIQVWKEIVRVKPLAKLAVIGPGISSTLEEFKKKIREVNLGENIIYFGFVSSEKKYEILSSSKLFIFLSKVDAEEAWAISLMEALACGLPALTYNLKIYKHIYGDGILQKSKIGDINSVIQKTLFFLNNKKERDILSKKGMSFARQFDWFKIAEEDLKKIRKIILNDLKSKRKLGLIEEIA